jgi:hypothetical protein
MGPRTVVHIPAVATLARAVAVLAIIAGVAMTSTGFASASAIGCGDHSFGFAGTRLLNDGISDSAGPFAIVLPAGVYDITMQASDNHPSADYQIEQTQEQWYFTLDNGYTSPPTPDVPADKTQVTMTVEGVELTAATAISVHHLREGGVNSVNVDCIGFTPSIVAPPATTEPPQIGGPIGTVPPATAPPTTVIVLPPTTDAVSPPTTTVPVEVKPAVEEVQELALTGRSTTPVAVTGVGLLLLGAAFLAAERREQRRVRDR